MNTTLALPNGPHYQLRFQSLFRQGRGWAFPCDAQGQVDMDAMSDHVRDSYLFARALVGLEVSHPQVQLAY